MSDVHSIIIDTVERLFDEQINHDLILATREGRWPDEAWQAIVNLGLPQAMVGEEDGGIGLSASDALDIVRLAGAAALPLPLGETIVTHWLATRLGIDAPDGPLTFASETGGNRLRVSREQGQIRLAGLASRVPAGRNATAILTVAASDDGDVALLVPREKFSISAGQNIAGEPRDDLCIDGVIDAKCVVAAPPFDGDDLLALGAALRSAALAGAIERILAITTAYANERVQFGKPIGRQQAIQHLLAQLAGEAAAARAAAAMAGAAIGSSGLSILPIAAAKARAGEAAGKAASIAHQVHGAIGFTREHRLHDLTTRLWAWRDEFGNERHWNMILGRAALAAGGEGYWPFVTSVAEAGTKGMSS